MGYRAELLKGKCSLDITVSRWDEFRRFGVLVIPVHG